MGADIMRQVRRARDEVCKIGKKVLFLFPQVVSRFLTVLCFKLLFRSRVDDEAANRKLFK